MMDDTKKLVLLEVLRIYWNRHPKQRLGQLLYNVVAPVEPCSDLFYISDKDLQKLLENEI